LTSFIEVLKISVISGYQLPVTEASIDKTTYCDESFLYNMWKLNMLNGYWLFV